MLTFFWFSSFVPFSQLGARRPKIESPLFLLGGVGVEGGREEKESTRLVAPVERSRFLMLPTRETRIATTTAWGGRVGGARCNNQPLFGCTPHPTLCFLTVFVFSEMKCRMQKCEYFFLRDHKMEVSSEKWNENGRRPTNNPHTLSRALFFSLIEALAEHYLM